MIHLISYDLNNHERPSAYTEITKIIKENADDLRKPLYSQWFVKTELSPNKWLELLKPALDNDDNVFIMKVQQPYQGWLSKDIYAWLDANL